MKDYIKKLMEEHGTDMLPSDLPEENFGFPRKSGNLDQALQELKNEVLLLKESIKRLEQRKHDRNHPN